MNINEDLVRKAFKKLKSNVYFDKTNIILRDKLVKFESESGFKKRLESVFSYCTDYNENFENDILKSIQVLSYPKSIRSHNGSFINNRNEGSIEVEKCQYHISMKVEGYILGILWVMLVGTIIDKNFYEHSYGNRLHDGYIKEEDRASLNFDKGNKTASNLLFKPYFTQYESWRNNALNIAKEYIDKDKNVMISMLDLKSYFYSVDMNDKVKERLLSEYKNNEELTNFIFKVFKKYSECLKELDSSLVEERTVLPIGFAPSSILSNWVLDKFDKAVIDGWNPVYYGRYVDDILIVDKFEENSDVRKIFQQSNPDEALINYLFTSCSKFKGAKNIQEKSSKNECRYNSKYSLFKDSGENKSSADNKDYKLNNLYYIVEKSKQNITIQGRKTKFFYFDHLNDDILIESFKKEIFENISEFRYLPEELEDANIFSLERNDSINKLSAIKGIKINKFETSKYLGKMAKILMLTSDYKKFENKQFEKMFNSKDLIDIHILWEKIFEIYLISNKFDELVVFSNIIYRSIEQVKFAEQEDECSEKDRENYNKITKKLKGTLKKHLMVSLIRASTINRKILERENDFLVFSKFKSKKYKKPLHDQCINYIKCRMVNKYVIHFPVDIFLENGNENEIPMINFSDYFSVLSLINNKDEDFVFQTENLIGYPYHPYYISFQEVYYIRFFENLTKDNQEKINVEDTYKKYFQANYWNDRVDNTNFHFSEINDKSKFEDLSIDSNNKIFKVGNNINNNLKISVSNVCVNIKKIDSILKDEKRKITKEYEDLAELFRVSIKEKSDILVMPECFLPVQFIPLLMQKCAKENMGFISGLEHIKIKDKIYNYTVSILPFYDQEIIQVAFIPHLKTHYSPKEIETISGYHCKHKIGNSYELISWNNIFLTTYCCYEIASIKDRTAFYNYIDVFLAIEHNPDVEYFSNIMESMSRDMHCYCVQVNSSNYGDSRIISPQKSFYSNVLKIKGGRNTTAIVDEINIESLRDYQRKKYSLQKDSKSNFKPTPPNFNHEIVVKKIKRSLL